MGKIHFSAHPLDMETIVGVRNFHQSRYRKPIVVAIGNFDGVHLGHQAIIRAAVETARLLCGTSVVLTFHPHPRKVLHPGQNPPLITSLPHRLALLRGLHPNVIVLIRFNKKFSRIQPKKFVETVLERRLGAAIIIIGEKFNFGKDKQGNAQFLQKQGRRLGRAVIVIPGVKKQRHTVSSTVVRRLIERGQIHKASKLLGRPFSIWGTVVRGERRGGELGFPTANIDTHQEAIPPNGVYAAAVKIEGKTYRGMINVGYRPTFPAKKRKQTCEVYIFNFHKDIYEKEIEVIFIKRIRKEKKFLRRDQLIHQLNRDRKKISLFLRKAQCRQGA